MKIKRNKNWLWGLFLLLIAGGIVASQLGWIDEIGTRTIIAGAFAVIILFNCITRKSITMLPFAGALVYIVLRNQELVPHVATWALLLAAWLTTIGLKMLLPKKKRKKNFIFTFNGGDIGEWSRENGKWGSKKDKRRAKAFAEMGALDDNPSVSTVGAVTSRYIQADSLETVTLSCHFGGIDIYLDEAQLSPDGAVVDVDCKFGGIDIYVPRHWHVTENISCTLGGADINGRRENVTEDSPKLTVTGNVMFGGVDINYI